MGRKGSQLLPCNTVCGEMLQCCLMLLQAKPAWVSTGLPLVVAESGHLHLQLS